MKVETGEKLLSPAPMLNFTEKDVFGTMPEPFCVHGIKRLAQKILFPVENIPLSLSAVPAKHIIANRVLRNFVPS